MVTVEQKVHHSPQDSVLHELNGENFLLVLCTCPSLEIAETLSTLIVSKKLAGCVNILPQVTSIYRWQDRVEKNQECMLFIKSHKAQYDHLEQLIRRHHPYQIPEIIAFPIINGLVEYLTWIKENLQ